MDASKKQAILDEVAKLRSYADAAEAKKDGECVDVDRLAALLRLVAGCLEDLTK